MYIYCLSQKNCGCITFVDVYMEIWRAWFMSRCIEVLPCYSKCVEMFCIKGCFFFVVDQFKGVLVVVCLYVVYCLLVGCK